VTGATIDLTSTSGVIEFVVVIAAFLLIAFLIVRFIGRDRSVRVARLGVFIERQRFLPEEKAEVDAEEKVTEVNEWPKPPTRFQ
jgi:hypothetical protein